MKIDTPSSTLGIRGTTGLVEVPEGGAAGGQVSIKLYPDADGRVGRIEVFGRDGAQLGILSRGATGFAIRPGAGGRFTRRALANFARGSRARPHLRAPDVRGADRRSPDQSATPARSSGNAISYGPINPISNGPASCRDASSGLDCSNSDLSSGRCQADSRCRRPRQRSPLQQQPGARPTQQQPGARPLQRRRHPYNNSRARSLRSSNQARRRPAVDRMRRHCSNSPACGRRCSGQHSCRVHNARPPDRASRQRKTKAVSAPTNRYACCQSGRRRRTRQG